MKLTTDLKVANELLQKYIGASVQVWMFSPSLKRVVFRISLANFNEIIYLIGIRCEWINGRFGFKNTELSISKETNSNNEKITRICDKSEGFELITSSGFTLALGLESEFGSTLDNFFIGAVSSDQ